MSGRRLSALFTWRSAIAESNLEPPAKHVALTLSLHMSERGDSAFPSLKTQARECSLSKTTVAKYLAVLEECGWLHRRPGGGRGHRTFYEATLPETVRQADTSLGATGSQEEVKEAAEASLAAAPLQGRPTLRRKKERVREADTSSGPETVREASESVHLEAGKCPPVGTEVVKQESDKTAAAGAAAAGDEGIELDRALSEVGVGATLRLEALQDLPRARAWLNLAKAEADTNPAGYFRNGFKSGEWPSQRIGQQGPRGRAAWIEGVSWRFEPEDAHAIVGSWTDLDDVERSRLHEQVDAVRERREAEQTEVAAA